MKLQCQVQRILQDLRITDVDESGLTTYFTNLSLAISNGLTPANILGQLGPFDFNIGILDIQMTATVWFSNAAVIERIRNNETVTMDAIIYNREGVIGFDFPSIDMNLDGRGLSSQ